MEINAAGFAAKELVPQRGGIEKDVTQQALAKEKDETIEQTQKPQEPRPVEQASGDKLSRIDIYA